MNKFWIRLYNGLNCEIDARSIEVPEGQDYGPALRDAVIELIKDTVLDPGDIIKITED